MSNTIKKFKQNVGAISQKEDEDLKKNTKVGFWSNYSAKKRQNLNHAYKMYKNPLKFPLGKSFFDRKQFYSITKRNYLNKVDSFLNKNYYKNELSAVLPMETCFFCLKRVFRIERHIKVRNFYLLNIILIKKKIF